jgi:hypothetical protein
MAKSKELIENDDEEYEYGEAEEEENEFSNFNDGEVPSNSLHLAALAAKDSDTLKHFKELPKEIKHSFYDGADIKEVRHRLKSYKDFMYIRKMLKLQNKEIKNIQKKKKEIYKIKTELELYNYYKSINEVSTFYMIKRAGLIQQALKDITKLEKNGFEEDMINNADLVNHIWKEYGEEYEKPEFIDDVGNLGIALDFSVTSSGRGGNERLAGITAIQATRDIDIQQKNEEKTRHNLFSGFMRKFR